MRAIFLCFFLIAFLGSAHAADVWSTALAERPTDGWKIFYRYIEKLEDDSQRSQFPTAVTLTWKYESPNGLPAKPQVDAIYKLEDLLEQSVELKGEGRLAFIVTGNNQRSWTYYVKSETLFRAALAEAVRSAQLELEVFSAPDPQWSRLEGFRKSIRP